jgi:putative copper resistance protein D
MKMLYLVSVFIHIICACIWLGGMFALIIFFIPLRKENYFLDMVNKVGNQFKFVGWIILPLLLLTGIFNSFYRGFYTLTWLKILLFSIIVIISAIHDFYIGPKATKTKDKKLIKYSRIIGRINFILAIIMVLLGVFIVRGF